MKSKGKCKECGGWIDPPWTRGDGEYRHCHCSKNDDPDYEPFGPEWKSEMMKFNKAHLIDTLRKILIQNLKNS
jgi:hypothetical protein